LDITDEGLVLTDRLPVSVQVLDTLPEKYELAVADQENESFLKTSLVWQEPVDLDDLDQVGQELRRQDLKISLLLEMMSELLAQNNTIPKPRKLKLSTKGLAFGSGTVELNAGQQVSVMIYIVPSFPKALKLYGEIHKSEDGKVTMIAFEGVSQSVKEALDKLIFRHHRREVAMVRRL